MEPPEPKRMRGSDGVPQPPSQRTYQDDEKNKQDRNSAPPHLLVDSKEANTILYLNYFEPMRQDALKARSALLRKIPKIEKTISNLDEKIKAGTPPNGLKITRMTFPPDTDEKIITNCEQKCVELESFHMGALRQAHSAHLFRTHDAIKAVQPNFEKFIQAQLNSVPGIDDLKHEIYQAIMQDFTNDVNLDSTTKKIAALTLKSKQEKALSEREASQANVEMLLSEKQNPLIGEICQDKINHRFNEYRKEQDDKFAKLSDVQTQLNQKLDLLLKNAQAGTQRKRAPKATKQPPNASAKKAVKDTQPAKRSVKKTPQDKKDNKKDTNKKKNQQAGGSATRGKTKK